MKHALKITFAQQFRVLFHRSCICFSFFFLPFFFFTCWLIRLRLNAMECDVCVEYTFCWLFLLLQIYKWLAISFLSFLFCISIARFMFCILQTTDNNQTTGNLHISERKPSFSLELLGRRKIATYSLLLSVCFAWENCKCNFFVEILMHFPSSSMRM